MKYTNQDYFKKNIYEDSDDILKCRHENVSKKDFKDYEILRKRLLDFPQLSVKYDNEKKLRPSCVPRFEALVQAYDMGIDESQKTIENFNWDVEQQIIIWRGGF